MTSASLSLSTSAFRVWTSARKYADAYQTALQVGAELCRALPVLGPACGSSLR